MILYKLNFILTKSEKNKLLFLLFGTLILAILETFSIGIIFPIMNLFINQDMIQTSGIMKWLYQFIGARNNVTFLIILIVAAFVLFILKSVFSILIRLKQKSVIGNIFVRLTTKVLASYLNRPYLFHLQNNSAIMFKNATTAVSSFSTYFLLCLISIVTDSVILLAIFCLLVILYPVSTLLLGCVLTLTLIFVNLLLKKRIKSYSLQSMKTSEQVFKFGLEALQGVKEIKIYDTQDFFIGRYSRVSKGSADSDVKFSIVSSLPRNVLDIILFTFVLLVLLVNIYFHKSATELIPMMMVFGLGALRVLPSIQNIYTSFNSAKYYSYNLDIVYDILKDSFDEKILEKFNSIDSPKISKESQSIRLENAKYHYKTAANPIFKELSIVIPKQKTVAFVGETGAGKSTLIDILMGLLTPDSGVLYYGEEAVTFGNISEYRRKISYVPQHIFLMDDTLEVNITFGIPMDKIDYGQLSHVIQISQLEPLVNSLPDGIRTVVGERGARLSGGERQRIAIARALYRNPEIIIFDEATSALDRNTEAKLYNAIRNSKKECTIIFVTHRANTLEHADYIYVMDSGKIVGQGSYKELLEGSEVFRKIIHQTMPSADKISE